MSPVTVISLTESGRALGDRIADLYTGAVHIYRPQPFATIVRNQFLDGRRLALIMASGIAVRVLAPVLADKRKDPAVVVLDDKGRFVVPLISGHEGGGNEWARLLAGHLGAQCVITSAETYTRPTTVAGMGCDRGCPAETLEMLLHETLAQTGLAICDLAGLSSIELKRGEPGLKAMAGRLGLSIGFYPPECLHAYVDRLSARSEIVFRETGCYGVAEAAALAHAEHLTGSTAELIVAKRKNARATCAVARAYARPPPGERT